MQAHKRLKRMQILMDNTKHVLMFGVSPFTKATNKPKQNKNKKTNNKQQKQKQTKRLTPKICDERFFFVFFLPVSI